MNVRRSFPSKDLSGKRFGKLSVIEFDNYYDVKGRRIPKWKCICDCGTVKSIPMNYLTTKQVRSCGCLLKENYIKLKTISVNKNKKTPGEAAFNEVLNSYKQRAKRKNYNWDLSLDEFKKIINRDCYYCGITPSQEWKTANGSIFYNGIDRKDNSKGYTLENSVPCCKICNYAKRNLSEIEFLSWIERLIKYNKDLYAS